ncbi:MAG: hypothetical protein M3N52_09135 [Actinomycetota bacterium]|nr:hypothetical protein [Actinomycetota bacterium]
MALLALLAVDAALTALLERRLAAALGHALGIRATVELYGWPVVPRVLAGVVPRAKVAGASDDGSSSSLAALEAWLTAVDVDPQALADGGQPVSIASSGGRLTVTFRKGAEPLGAAQVVATLEEVAARVGPDRAAIRVGAAVVYGSELGQAREDLTGVLFDARLQGVAVELTDPPVGAGSVAAAAQRGSLQARGHTGGALPLGASSLGLDFQDGVANGDAAGPLLGAEQAQVVATRLRWPGSPASVSRLDGTFQDLRIDRRGAGPRVLTSSHATLAAEIDESAVNAVWPLPGQVSLLDERARLTVGPVTLDVEVGAEAGDLLLQPRMPPALRPLVDDLPALRLPAMLPHGAVLEEAQVESGLLLLRASGQRLEVPVGRGS